MNSLFLCDQDRENVYPIDINSLHPVIPVGGTGTTAVYLTMEAPDKYGRPKTVMLGDFDSLQDVIKEVSAICNFKGNPGDVYRVSGYSNSEGDAFAW